MRVQFPEYQKSLNNSDFWNLSVFNFKASKSIYLVVGILDIYKGKKYNDCCISEIKILK